MDTPDKSNHRNKLITFFKSNLYDIAIYTSDLISGSNDRENTSEVRPWADRSKQEGFQRPPAQTKV